MNQSVELEPQEWQQVISALAMTNPLLVKISVQLQQQQARAQAVANMGVNAAVSGLHPGNSKEPSHGL